MVSDTGEATGTLSFSNARITTSVPIKKVDDKGNPLAGATIVVLDAKQKQVFSGKTGTNGVVTVSGLQADNHAQAQRNTGRHAHRHAQD